MNLSPELSALLVRAQERARERRQAACEPEQVLETLLVEAGETAAALPVSRVLDGRAPLPFDPPAIGLARVLRTGVLTAASERASAQGRLQADVGDLRHALLGPGTPISGELAESVRRRLVAGRAASRAAEPATARASAAPPATAASPSSLVPFDAAPDDETLVDRDPLVDRVLQGLLFGSVAVIGAVGSGRRALLHLVARRRRQGRWPRALAETPLLELDPTRLVAGTGYRGDLEQRMQQLVESLPGGGDAIVVVQNLARLVGAGHGAGGTDVAAALVPALRSGRFRLLGATTPDEARERLETCPELDDRLVRVPVPEIDEVEAVRLLSRVPERVMARFGIAVDAECTRRAVELCCRHVPHLALPGAPRRLVETAAATLAFETEAREAQPDRSTGEYWRRVGPPAATAPGGLGERHLLHALSQLHRLPFEHLEHGVAERLAGFEREFRSSLFGQDHALETVERTVRVALMQLADHRRPRGRLFFVGPPGTGKTECARLVARLLMGRDDELLRFDMSDYQEPSSVSTLIGSDKGLVGSDEGGRLTEPLRESPHRVILFDEIEKAHPNVFNLFLQMLDSGDVRDKRGRLVSFRHAICIFTSNAGCGALESLAGLTRAEITTRLQRTFRPEFLDRIDEFVPFAPLGRAARREVARVQLEDLRDEVERVHGRPLSWTAATVEHASREPRDQAGVRNILRWLQSDVKPAVARALLDPSAGSDLRVDVDAGGVVVVTAENAAPNEVDGAAVSGCAPSNLDGSPAAPCAGGA